MLLGGKKELTILYHEKELTVPVIFSRRKSLSIEVKPDMTVVVKAPQRVSFAKIKDFVLSRQDWISRKLDEYRRAPKPISQTLTPQEKSEYRKEARRQITAYARSYADQMGISYGRIAIKEQKTCWGSCSSKRNLNFNWKLILMPKEIMEYVVVHELAHLFEMNHSPEFWNIVGRYLPDYKKRRKWLKDNGKYY